VSAAAGAVGSPGVLVGVGIDAVDIERFRRVLSRRPSLAARLFSDAERREAAAATDPTPVLAARFAAKEAVMKALGTGLWAYRFSDVEVVGPGGGTALRLGRQAARRAEDLGVAGWHVSITADGPVAMAVVSAEASPVGVETPAP
jgi:holo-[acyl-carrier protein] synthase